MERDRATLQRRLEKLRSKHVELMRGRLVPSTRAQLIQREIIDVKNEIKRIDRDAAQRLALEKAPIDKVLEVIAIPLLADVMNDIVAGVDATLRDAGVQETIFGDYIKQIRSLVGHGRHSRPHRCGIASLAGCRRYPCRRCKKKAHVIYQAKAENYQVK